MYSLGEVCPVCFDDFKDPIILSCSHKVCRRCLQNLVSPRNQLTRSLEDVLAAAVDVIDLEQFQVTCPYRCIVSSAKLAVSPLINPRLRLSMDSVQDTVMSKAIVCFLIDGSEKYMEMTIRAINSLMQNTPRVFVGVLIPPNYDAMDLYSRFLDPTRVIFKEYRHRFNWNPTQYKLDIQQFAGDFTCVFWLDSDTIVYRDLTPVISNFYFSMAKFAFVKDHVCTNAEFLSNWRNKVSPFIPQACFMGFKSDYIHIFFKLWEDIWRRWIEPSPFFNYPDPLPSFPASAFCIEQYALGMAVEHAGVSELRDIIEIRRICIPLSETVFGPTRTSLHRGVLNSLVAKFWSHLNFNSSVGLNLLTSFSGNSSGSSFWIDDIDAHIIHFYSLNYDVTYGWWSNYHEEIIAKIDQLWHEKNKALKKEREQLMYL